MRCQTASAQRYTVSVSSALLCILFMLFVPSSASAQQSTRGGIHQNRPKRDAIPIVAVTSCTIPGDCERYIEAGCNGYLERSDDLQTFAVDVERFPEPAS